jgi:hypothetical protein
VSVRNFEPNVPWVDDKGMLTERAKGFLRSLFDYIGAATGAIPSTSLGGNGISTTTFLREDGTYAIPDYPVGANPSGTVGPTATNGTAFTFMRSDAAPALDLTVPYTFTNSLAADSLTAANGFGCNGKTAQTEATIGAAVVTTAATNAAPYGYATAAQADDIVTRINTIRAALIANGILS